MWHRLKDLYGSYEEIGSIPYKDIMKDAKLFEKELEQIQEERATKDVSSQMMAALAGSGQTKK